MFMKAALISALVASARAAAVITTDATVYECSTTELSYKIDIASATDHIVDWSLGTCAKGEARADDASKQKIAGALTGTPTDSASFVIDRNCLEADHTGVLKVHFGPEADSLLVFETREIQVTCGSDGDFSVDYDFNVELDSAEIDGGSRELDWEITQYTTSAYDVEKDRTVADNTGDLLYFEITTAHDELTWTPKDCAVTGAGSSYSLFDLYDESVCVEDYIDTALSYYVKADGSIAYRLSYTSFTFGSGATEQAQKLVCTIRSCNRLVDDDGLCAKDDGHLVGDVCKADFTFFTL